MARLCLALCLTLVTFGTVGSSPLHFVSEIKSAFPFLGSIDCDLCRAGVYLFQTLVGTSRSEDDITKAAIEVCEVLKIEDHRVCNGIIHLFAPQFFTVLDKLALKPSEVCGFIFGDSCGDPYDPYTDWNVTFPNVPQPTPIYPKPPKQGSPQMRFLHLSDIHFDARYKVGSIAECGEPLCCREGDGGQKGAGKFGDYRNCDTPLWTLENMFAHLAAKNDFDYIIWTGDLPAHNVWNQTKEAQTKVIGQLTDLILKYFPNKPIYPALGNHESSPVNSFPPAYIKGNNSINWLYNALVDGWKHWLPKEALATIKWGGYYTVSPYPGFRIISLNMNYCNNENFWMLLNTTDPNGELQWFINTLQQAEDNKEKVHVLGHIPPGNGDCLKTWSWNYYKIISRYQNTIAGQFFGHDHPDSFEVFYDVETLKIPISVAYLGPSVTTYSNLNPAYRMYTADGMYNGSSYQILDHETYFLNLTKANAVGHITWELEYSAKAAYNMTNTFPKDWDLFIERMKNDYSVIKLYNKYFHKSVDDGTCDAQCRSWLPCMARSGRSYDPSLCKDLGLGTRDKHKEALKKRTKHC